MEKKGLGEKKEREEESKNKKRVQRYSMEKAHYDKHRFSGLQQDEVRSETKESKRERESESRGPLPHPAFLFLFVSKPGVSFFFA